MSDDVLTDDSDDSVSASVLELGVARGMKEIFWGLGPVYGIILMSGFGESDGSGWYEI